MSIRPQPDYLQQPPPYLNFPVEPWLGPRLSKYRPLNHQKSSIRLLRILPGTSSTGHIQCTLQHANVDDDYTCLSYVWGPPDAGRFILLNGDYHPVRRNLFDFLKIARSRHTDKLLWIDALCIDQENDIERNHQVQQMGDIFSKARGVLAWFGTDPAIEKHLATISRGAAAPSSVRRYFESYRSSPFKFVDSPYWTRAWVTQEVLLARRLTLCAGYAELDAARLKPLCQISSFYPPTVRNLIAPVAQVKRTSLISLIQKHRGKACHTARDRIYSLLSICGEGSRLRVDYQAATGEVLLKTMRSCPRSICICSVACVAATLDYDVSPTTQQRWRPHRTATGLSQEEEALQQLTHRDPRSLCSCVLACIPSTNRRYAKDESHFPNLLGIGRLSAQLPAKKVPIYNGLARCWNCSYPWTYPNAAMFSILVVCLNQVCNHTRLHLVIILASEKSCRIRRCMLVDDSPYETILDLSEVGLTAAEGNTFNLCVSLACVMVIARASDMGTMHCIRVDLQEDRGESAGRMQLCHHDAHGYSPFHEHLLQDEESNRMRTRKLYRRTLPHLRKARQWVPPPDTGTIHLVRVSTAQSNDPAYRTVDRIFDRAIVNRLLEKLLLRQQLAYRLSYRMGQEPYHSRYPYNGGLDQGLNWQSRRLAAKT